MGKTNLGRVAFVPRGAYNNETSYKRLDVVEYEGSSYLFLKDSTGITPTGDGEVTMLLAKKGKDFIYDDFTPEQLAALKGEKGDKGDSGKGLSILGYYGTLDLLKAAITAPEPGDTYGIGTAAPYNIYVFDGITSDWVDNGTMSGGGGEGGGNSVVLIPVAVLNLTNESTSAEILTAFGGKDVFIDVVTKVKGGAPLALDVNGSLSPVQYSFGSFVQEQNQYQLAFIYVNPLDASNNLVISIQLTGDVATIEKSNHPLGYANIVSIPPDVMSLSNESTSDEIKTAFGGKPAFDTIIEKVRADKAVGIITDINSSVSGLQLQINGYTNADNVTLDIGIIAFFGVFNITVTVTNGVFKFSITTNRLLFNSELVSDPSVGGTDKPASAEAVKVVNDKIGWQPDPDSTEEQVCVGEFFKDFDGVKKQVYYKQTRGSITLYKRNNYYEGAKSLGINEGAEAFPIIIEATGCVEYQCQEDIIEYGVIGMSPYYSYPEIPEASQWQKAYVKIGTVFIMAGNYTYTNELKPDAAHRFIVNIKYIK